METSDYSDDESTRHAGVWLIRPVQAAIFLLVFCSPLAAQQDAGRAAVLEPIKERVVNHLRALPNYTCAVLIERSGRKSARRSFENIDRIRLEVGYVGGSEVYGWPGGDKIAQDDLRELVGGTITDGDFALITRAVFAGPGVVFRNIHRADAGGRAVVSGEFTASREGSQWVLAVGRRVAPVGYTGSFQVDAGSFQLIDLRMTAEHIPREFGYREIARTLEFQQVRIGSHEFLLPSRAELSTVARDGQETKNETRFTNCHEFTAESVISFDAPSQEAELEAAHQAPVSTADLPDEFEAYLELESPIDSDTSAVGDPITARLVQDITGKGGMKIPKGAILHGRISRLDVTEGHRLGTNDEIEQTAGHRYLNFAFTYFEWGGRRVEIAGRENQLVTWSPQSFQASSFTIGPIRAYGTHIEAHPGFRFRLKSRAGGQ